MSSFIPSKGFDPREVLQSKYFVIALIALGVIACVLLALRFSSGGNLEAESKKENSEIELVSQLLAMQEELSALRAQLKDKKQADSMRGSNVGQRSYLASAKNSYVGFTPQNGFQEISKTKKDSYIPRGSVFKARTLTSIKTSISESFVVAETTKIFELDSKRRLPKGSRLIGSARLNPVLKGLIVRFDTIVLPSGKQLDGVKLLALDHRAFPEIEGIFFSDKAEVYGTAMAFGFLGGFSSAAQDRESTLSGSMPTSSLKNQVLGGMSASSFAVAEDMLKDIRDKAIEYVVLPAGEDIYVVFEEKLNVDPERGFQ